MGILDKALGLFINGKKVTDIKPDSEIEVQTPPIQVSTAGYVNHGNFQGNVSFGSRGISNSPNTTVINSFNDDLIGEAVFGENMKPQNKATRQHITANSIGAIIGGGVNAEVHFNSLTEPTVIVDGKSFPISDYSREQVINIEIRGNFQSLKSNTANTTVHGNVDKVKNNAGNITIYGDVSGDVSNKAGNINVQGDIAGDVSTTVGNISKGRG